MEWAELKGRATHPARFSSIPTGQLNFGVIWSGRSVPDSTSHTIKDCKVSIGTTIMNVLFGCRHRNLSRAFTSEGETYKVCLKCGTRLQYSWQTMSLVRENRRKPQIAAAKPLTDAQRRVASEKR